MPAPAATLPIGVATRPNLNPSPKARFTQSPDNISRHRAMLETREFERGIDFALLEYQAQLGTECSANPLQMGGITGLKMTGALEFIQTLKLLSEKPTVVRPNLTQNLDHSAT